jgi:hypothetical protein
VSICVRAGLPKPRGVPDTERTKDTKTLDYASTPLDANTLLAVRLIPLSYFCLTLIFFNNDFKNSKCFWSLVVSKMEIHMLSLSLYFHSAVVL